MRVDDLHLWTGERRARAALTGIVEPASAGLLAQLQHYSVEEVWTALRESKDKSSLWARRAEALNLERTLDLVHGKEVHFLIPGDPQWPEALPPLDGIKRNVQGIEMQGQPLGLWWVGEDTPRQAFARAVSIVGSRASTSYGERVASDFGAELAAEGFTIVSGGAYGVDAAAHRGALAGGGRTVAVLANGLDSFYPRGNNALLDRVASAGAIVAEVAPGIRPNKVGFLARNRIIAAVGRGVVLVEAAHRSGALNTANWAEAMQRQLLCVPGSIYSATSAGVHGQLRKYGTLVATTEHVLKELGPMEADPLPGLEGDRPTDGLTGNQLLVREALPSRGGMAAAAVAETTGLPYPQVLAALGMLELEGLAEEVADGRWRVTRPKPSARRPRSAG